MEILAQNHGRKISVGSQPSEGHKKPEEHKKTPRPVRAHRARPEAALV
jgi:hypothetical protein